MKRFWIKLASCLPILGLTGCAYLHDRGRDACDMLTLAGEMPTVNAAVQLGPVLAAGVQIGRSSNGVFRVTNQVEKPLRLELDRHLY